MAPGLLLQDGCRPKSCGKGARLAWGGTRAAAACAAGLTSGHRARRCPGAALNGGSARTPWHQREDPRAQLRGDETRAQTPRPPVAARPHPPAAPRLVGTERETAPSTNLGLPSAHARADCTRQSRPTWTSGSHSFHSSILHKLQKGSLSLWLSPSWLRASPRLSAPPRPLPHREQTGWRLGPSTQYSGARANKYARLRLLEADQSRGLLKARGRGQRGRGLEALASPDRGWLGARRLLSAAGPGESPW